MRYGFSLVLLAAAATVSATEPIRFYGAPPPHDEPMRRIGDDRFRFTGTAAATAMSPDGRRLAVLSTSEIRRTATISIFDVTSRRPLVIARVPVTGVGVFAGAGLAFSPDGTRIAVTVNSSTAFVLDASTGREIWRDKAAKDTGHALAAFDAAGRLIRTGESQTRIIDPATGTVTATWPAGGIAAVTRDGKTYVRVKKAYAEIEIGDATNGQSRHVLPLRTAHDGGENGFAFSNDGRTLAVVHSLSEIHLVDVATGQTRQKWKLVEHTLPPLNAEFAIGFSPDDKSLVLSTTARILAWNLEPFAARKELPQGQSEFVHSWQFSADGTTIRIPRNGLIEQWNAATGERIVEEFALGGEAFALTPDGVQLVTGDRLGRVGVWNAETGAFVRNLGTNAGVSLAVRSLAVSPDGRHVAIYRQEDGDLEVFPLNATAAAPARTASIASARTYLIAWSPDGRHVYGYRTEKYRREFVQFDAIERKKVKAIDLKEPLALSSNGNEFLYVLSSSKIVQNMFVTTAEVHRHEIATAKPLGKLPADVRDNRSFERAIGRCSPDGSLVALATDHRIELVGSKLLPFDASDPLLASRADLDSKISTLPVRALAFTPNGRWLVTAGDDCAVKVWEVATGKLVKRMDGHDSAVANVAVARDGRSVYSGGRDSPVQQWDLLPANAKLPAQSDELWKAAVAADPATGSAAAWKLIADDRLRSFVKERLPPVPKIDPAKVKRWLAELDAPAFADRKAAARALEELSRGVEAELRATLATTPSAEVRERVEGLIARFEGKFSPEEVRAMRLVHACEWYRANDLLATWASGTPSAALTFEAKAALARMK